MPPRRRRAGSVEPLASTRLARRAFPSFLADARMLSYIGPVTIDVLRVGPGPHANCWRRPGGRTMKRVLLRIGVVAAVFVGSWVGAADSPTREIPPPFVPF